MDGGKNEFPAQADDLRQLEIQEPDIEIAVLGAAQTRKFDIVYPRRNAEGVQHRRAADDEDGNAAYRSMKMLADGQHPSDVAQTKRIVRIDH